MSNINNKLDYLDETKQLIKQAIIDKGQEVSDEDTFRSYVDKISDIETGNDTKDATATSNDILYPETAYISNGKVTGNIMPIYSSNTTLSQTNTISRSLSYSLLDINYDAKIAIVSDEDYKFNFCNIVNNEIDYENSAYITLNDFEEGMDGTYTFSKCCTNFDKNTNDLYLYLLFTFQNTFKVFCYIYNIKTKSSKYIDTYELTIDDANNSLVLNMMIRPNYPNQVIVFCGYTSTTALGSYLTTVFLQFNTVALELQKIEDTISTSSNQYAAKVESCYFTSNGEYLCINVRTGTLSGTTQNGIIYHCVNNFLESIADSTRYITLFENGNYMAYNQSTRNHCLFNVNGDVLHSYSGNLGEVSTEQLTYTNKCILGNYLFGFAYPEDFINPTEPFILYCCKLNEDYTITKEYEINVGSRTLFNCYNAILYDNKTTRNFDGYLGDTEKEIISLERNNTVYFSTKDSTADENDILSPKTAYSNGKKIIGNILTTYDNRNDNISVNTVDIAQVEACEYLYKENMYILGKEQMYILKQDSSSTAYSFENNIEGNIIRITSCYINNHTIIAVLTTSGEKLAYIYFYEMNSDKTLNYLTKLEFTSEQFYENQMTIRISNKNILAYTIRNRNKGSNYYFYQLKYEDNFSIELISQGVIGSGEIDFYTGKWSKDSTKYIILGQDYRYTGIFNLDNKGTVIDTDVSHLFYYFDFHTDDKVCYVNNNILSYCSYAYPFTFEPIFSINVTNNDWLNLFVLKDWCILYGKTKVQIYKIEANKFVHLYEFDSYYARLKDLNQINDKVYNLNKSTKALTVLYDEGISVIDSATIKGKVLYNTDLADATMNDVLQGKVFYNSEGKQIGNKIFTDYNDSVGILETNSAISATAVDQLIGVETSILPDIQYLDKVKVNDIVKVVITIIDVAASLTTLKCNCLAQILEIIDHSDKQFKANVRILAADVNTEDGTATSEDIVEGKTAYVNNERVHGTAKLGTDTSDADATPNDILSPKTAYVNGQKIIGAIIPKYDKDYSGELIKHDLNLNELLINNVFCVLPDDIFIVYIDLSDGFKIKVIDSNTSALSEKNITDYAGTELEIPITMKCSNLEDSDGCYNLCLMTRQNKSVFTYIFKLDKSTGSLSSNYSRRTSAYQYIYAPLNCCFANKSANIVTWVGSEDPNNVAIYRINKDCSITAVTYMPGQTDFYWIGAVEFSPDDKYICYNNSHAQDYGCAIMVKLSNNYTYQATLKFQAFTVWVIINASYLVEITNKSAKLYRYNVKSNKINLTYINDVADTPLTEIGKHFTQVSVLANGYYAIQRSEIIYIYKFDENSETVSLVQTIEGFTSSTLNSYSIQYNKDGIISVYTIPHTSYLYSLTKDSEVFYNTKYGSITDDKVLSGYIYFNSNGMSVGTMPNNKELNIEQLDTKQTIPEGYTSGGVIPAYPQTTSDYNECLITCNEILTGKSINILQYIQSSGTQYIDTGVVPTNNTAVEMSIKKVGNTIDYERLFGINNIYELIRRDRATAFELRFNGHDTNNVDINISTTDFTKLKFGQGQIDLNDEELGSYSNSFTTDKTAYLFYANGADRYGIMQLAYCKIWEGDELIRSFIPAKDFDNVICLYEEVEKKFYYNKGTGNFMGGEL